MKTIEITVTPNGQTSVETKGFSGANAASQQFIERPRRGRPASFTLRRPAQRLQEGAYMSQPRRNFCPDRRFPTRHQQLPAPAEPAASPCLVAGRAFTRWKQQQKVTPESVHDSRFAIASTSSESSDDRP